MTDEQNRPQPASAPNPVSERIAALIRRIDQGDVKLPTFQRPQVWDVGQAVDLLQRVAMMLALMAEKSRSTRELCSKGPLALHYCLPVQ